MIDPPQGLIATNIANSSIETGDIEDLAVTTSKLAASAVTAGKLADSAVTARKIGPSAVGTGQLAHSAVDSQIIAPSAVGTGRMADSAVTARKIGPSAVGTGQLADASVAPQKVQAGSAYTFGEVSAGALDMGGTTDYGDNAQIGIESSPSAVTAADLSNGQLIFDEASGGIAFKDDAGSAWFAHASALA